MTDDDDVRRELLALLSEEAPLPPSDADNPFSASLVRLHTSGHKRPFYCVHPGSGSAGCFTEIAPMIDPDRPFFALQTPGIDGEREPLQDLVALAEGYVREIRRAQPEGPYLIGGWSLGGTVAFHMAHVLREQGQEVAFLVLFDTVRTDALHVLPRPTAVDISYRQSALAVQHLARQRAVAIDWDLAYERFDRVRPRTTIQRLDLIFDVLCEQGVFETATAPMFRVFRANMFALTDYGMPVAPYDRTITLFRCRNTEFGPAFATVDESYCWSRSTTRPVEIVPIPAHHFGLFHGDALAYTGEQLRRCIDRADPR